MDEGPAPGFLAAWRWRYFTAKTFPLHPKLSENELLAKAPVGRSPTRKLLTFGAFFSPPDLSLCASKEKMWAVGDIRRKSDITYTQSQIGFQYKSPPLTEQSSHRTTRPPDATEYPAPGFLAAWRWRYLTAKTFPHCPKLSENELLAKAPVGRSPTRKLLTFRRFLFYPISFSLRQ